jgi:predicted O-methyltransferase YrrM
MSLLKESVRRVAPGLFRALKNVYKQREFRHKHGGSEYRAKMALVGQYGKKVILGPFAGMAYGDNVLCSAYVAKLVGSYEEELHPIVEEILQSKPTRVIDIGCAEGYYAVGFARRLPEAQVYAFDIDTDAQGYCADLAKLNGISDRVHINGLCTPETLVELTSAPAFVLCDCEGCEHVILDPAKTPGLAHCTLLIELHDFLVPGLTPCLVARFEKTHTVQLIDTMERDPTKYTVLSNVLPEDRYPAVREGRPAAMQWAYLTPLGAGAQGSAQNAKGGA